MLLRILYQILDIIFPAQFTEADFQNIPKPEQIPFQNMFAVFCYKDEKAQQIVKHLKRLPDRPLAKLCANAMFQEVKTRIDLNKNWLIIPIPTSRKGRKQRGFNQTELLAQSFINKCENFKLAKNILYKQKETGKQALMKNKIERQKNMQGCFGLKQEIMAGTNIILMDDVITTGATCLDAIRALEGCGSKCGEIVCLSLAH